jgi:hypothetical protein
MTLNVTLDSVAGNDIVYCEYASTTQQHINNLVNLVNSQRATDVDACCLKVDDLNRIQWITRRIIDFHQKRQRKDNGPDVTSTLVLDTFIRSSTDYVFSNEAQADDGCARMVIVTTNILQRLIECSKFCDRFSKKTSEEINQFYREQCERDGVTAAAMTAWTQIKQRNYEVTGSSDAPQAKYVS